ncbi:MAG TPA: outer membrane lipoprotein carrier protein LolA [Steroidobacteraceae bacterium]|nr:outer membrane lipoprotein carrier protein LolA [Steroidobacteraceae bacterium]
MTPWRAWELRLRAQCWLAWAAIFWVAAAAGAAPDASSTALERYLDGMTSLRTAFTQTVTDAHGSEIEAGAGTLVVLRPGKFRWDYQPRAATGAATGTAPGTAGKAAKDQASTPASGERGQLLVADGKNLWFYDRELAQVSVKPVAAALTATPVMLLSGSAAQLHESFEISAAGSHDGLDWVSVKPRSAEGDFSHAELGFARDRLLRMVVNDRLGQTVQLDFSRSERNARVDPTELQFKAPAGVDVIGTPQS